jgi:DMSO/TMAO reductase YedYZ molybdopterin-dependent catalytic subunit
VVRTLRGALTRLTHPPDRLRVGPFRESAFTSPLHSQRTAAWLGLFLGIFFSVCFLTGLVSHAIQHPPAWFEWPARPAGLYRVTQGIHVAAGLASIPLLLAKLWTVYPRLWTWPPLEGVAHAVERLSLLPLVGGAVFMLFSGLADVALWYPWTFFFPAAHFWAAWITMGALVVHVGAKSAVTAAALRRTADAQDHPEGAGLTRRGFLATVAAAAGTLTLTTVGQTIRPLSPLGLLAPRQPDIGPQGLPVNKTAREAGVVELAGQPSWRLLVEGRVATPLSLALEELRALEQREVSLPIACVEGWSADARWRGVPVRGLLEMAGADASSHVAVESLQPKGLYRRSVLNPSHARHPDTLLALALGGEPLHFDHGYPARLIAPNQPGVMQTKWVARLVVL